MEKYFNTGKPRGININRKYENGGYSMFKTKTRKFVQLLFKLTAMILVMTLLVSCGGRGKPSGKDEPDKEGKPKVEAQEQEKQDTGQKQQEEEEQVSEPAQQQEDEQKDKVSEDTGSPTTLSESFSSYVEAKGEVVSLLTDALASNPDTAMDSMSFFGLAIVDLAVVPASSFGMGEDIARTTLGMFGSEVLDYSENGNQYMIKWRNSEGGEYELRGEYNEAADALICNAFMDGKESVVWEYRKTSFGYVGQIYSVDESDGSAYVYQMAISGKDGVVGMYEASSAPSLLTGNEGIDFPKKCDQWFAIEGNTVTGVTLDGREISFTYTPEE
jgi:hypothetical protein